MTGRDQAGAGPRLAARGLAGGRGGRVVFSGVDLDISGGEVVVLRGANGAGKTTLLRTLAGLLKPMAGEVRIEAGGRGEEPARLVSYFGLSDGVKGALSVRDNLIHWRRLYGAPAARVAEAAAATRLADRLDLPAFALSSGQRRRLGFARLLIAGRPVWLLDEPTASLDAASTRGAEALIDAHRRAGGLAVIATHEPVAIAGAAAFVIEAV